MKKSINRFLDAQNRLVIQSADLSLESIATMVEGNAIDISPKYQRRERWSVEKQSALIESFLLNIPVPPIYLAEDEYGKYSVIDGKQRITAIHNFIKKGFILTSLETFTEIEGLNFASLPEQLRNALSIRPYLRVVTLLKQSDPELKYEVFTRLNTGGEKLLPQEIRNVAYRGPYNDLIFRLADHSFLRKQLKIRGTSSKPYKEMIDAEYVLRFFTLRELWENFPGNMRIAMDTYMRKHRNDTLSQINAHQELFTKSITAAEQIWGADAFKRPESTTYRNQILQGVFDVQMIPFALLSDKKISRINKKATQIKSCFFELYKSDEDFQSAIRQFTSNTDRVRTRISLMLHMLDDILS